jgi:hypothetical protein
MIVARSGPARIDRYQNLQYLGQVTPFEFDNDAGDKHLALAIHPNSQTLAALTSDYLFAEHLGDFNSSANLKLWSFDPQSPLTGGSQHAHGGDGSINDNKSLPYLDVAAAYSPNGWLLATGGGGVTRGGGYVQIWRMDGGVTTRLQGAEKLWSGATGTVALAFTDDNAYLTAVVRSDESGPTNCLDCGRVMVWDMRDPANVSPLWEVHEAPSFNTEAVKRAAISENGRYLALPEMNHERFVMGVGIWSLPTMQQIGVIPFDAQGAFSEVKDLDVSDDGHTIAFFHRGAVNPQNVNEPLIESLNLYVAAWNTVNDTLQYTLRPVQTLDPLYSGGFFLHVDSEYVYYIDPLYMVLTRVNYNTGEQTQMMSL